MDLDIKIYQNISNNFTLVMCWFLPSNSSSAWSCAATYTRLQAVLGWFWATWACNLWTLTPASMYVCVYIYILTNYCCIVSPGFKSHEDIAGSVLKPADVGAAVHEESWEALKYVYCDIILYNPKRLCSICSVLCKRRLAAIEAAPYCVLGYLLKLAAWLLCLWQSQALPASKRAK